MSSKLISKIVQVAWHRNGVSGAGFHAVLFETAHTVCANCKGHDSAGWTDGAGKAAPCPNCRGTVFETSTRLMVASVFDAPKHVAVFEVLKLSDPAIGVAFGENSYRGDSYEAELRAAIAREASDGSVRVGPFGILTKRKAAPPTKRKPTKRKGRVR